MYTAPVNRTATSCMFPPSPWPIRVAPPDGRCRNCQLSGVCSPADLLPGERARQDAVVRASRAVCRGAALFHAGLPFRSIYAVRSGSFKTIVLHRDGHEQITGFQIPGEVLGLDGVYLGRHNCDAVALEESSVCIIPFGQFETLCNESGRMRRHFYRLLSSEIVRESDLMLVLGTMTAEQRLAAFLIDLSGRFHALGHPDHEFTLTMSREEIGCFLGLKLETVSRMFSRFRLRGLVKSNGRQIHIVDLDGLAKV